METIAAPKTRIISKDFRPERALLAKLLAFSAQQGSGTKIDIRDQTGIPTGESSGKVEPTIEYALGMGLITAQRGEGGFWQLGLTPLGHVVFKEDRFLNESHTLWLMHLMLCRRVGLAMPAQGVVDAWFALFADSFFRLGLRFQRQDVTALLKERYAEKKSKNTKNSERNYINELAGLILNTYLENNSFGSLGVLMQFEDAEGVFYQRCPAPSDKSYYPVYAAYLYLIWDELFFDENQVALDRLEAESCFRILLGWGDAAVHRWLEWMVDTRLIQLDRYTGSAMLLRLSSTPQILGKIYSELI